MRKAVPELRVQPEANLQIYMKKGEAQQQRGLEESLPFHWRPAEIAVNAIIFKLVLAAKRRDPNAKAGGRGAGRESIHVQTLSRLGTIKDSLEFSVLIQPYQLTWPALSRGKGEGVCHR